MSFYNETEDIIKQSLDSIFNQTYAKLEYVIISDNPANVELNNFVQEYLAWKDGENIIFIMNDQNYWNSYSLNKWIQECNWDYIAIADSDDIYFLDRIEKQLNNLKLLNCDILYWGYSFIDKNWENIWKPDFNTIVAFLYRKLIWTNFFWNTTIFSKKIVFQHFTYNNKLRRAKDLDLILRLHKSEFKIWSFKEEILFYRINNFKNYCSRFWKTNLTLFWTIKCLKSNLKDYKYNIWFYLLFIHTLLFYIITLLFKQILCVKR